MKIAIWLDKDYNPEEGGGFSYYDKLVRSIDAYSFSDSLDICFVQEGNVKPIGFDKDILLLNYISSLSIFDKLMSKLPIIGAYFRKKQTRKQNQYKQAFYERVLKKNAVKLIYYLRQAECALPQFPFVVNNWDIGHCSTFAFPELVSDGQFERRNYFYTQILPKALMVFAESEAGKEELKKYTLIDDNKLRVVPIFAGNCVDCVCNEVEQNNILNNYGLSKNNYFFYPAQFWAHKNHVNLLYAFQAFLINHPSYKLVLTGSDKGNFAYIKSLTEQLKLQDAVIFPGFVSQETINTVYQNATALVMASYFGPTNMPPLEAMELACPIVCSNTEGHKEMLGESACYFDAQNIDDLLNNLEEIHNNNKSYKEAILKQNSDSIFKVNVALDRINKYLCEVAIIRNAWE